MHLGRSVSMQKSERWVVCIISLPASAPSLYGRDRANNRLAFALKCVVETANNINFKVFVQFFSPLRGWDGSMKCMLKGTGHNDPLEELRYPVHLEYVT